MKHDIPTLIESTHHLIQQASSEQRVGIIEEIRQAIHKRKKEIVDMIGVDIFDPNPQPESQRKKEEIAQYIVGPQIKDTPNEVRSETEATLQRVEKLKKEYSNFNKDYLNSLVNSLQSIVDEIKAIDRLKLNPTEEKIKKAEILNKHGLKKWLGERAEGIRPIQFVEKYYKKWLDAGVLFKASLRTLDKELVFVFRDRHTLYNEHNPLIIDTQRTEMLAAGIIGDTVQQTKAQRLIVVRPEQRKISALLRS